MSDTDIAKINRGDVYMTSNGPLEIIDIIKDDNEIVAIDPTIVNSLDPRSGKYYPSIDSFIEKIDSGEHRKIPHVNIDESTVQVPRTTLSILADALNETTKSVGDDALEEYLIEVYDILGTDVQVAVE